MKRVITYGTYDVLHYGHINLLKRARALGDYLIVGLSSDEFNEQKSKKSVLSYKQRKEFLDNIQYVDMVINIWQIYKHHIVKPINHIDHTGIIN